MRVNAVLALTLHGCPPDVTSSLLTLQNIERAPFMLKQYQNYVRCTKFKIGIIVRLLMPSDVAVGAA